MPTRRVFGWSMWAALHGVVMLHQSGMLAHGAGLTRHCRPFLGHDHDQGLNRHQSRKKGRKAMTGRAVTAGERLQKLARDPGQMAAPRRGRPRGVCGVVEDDSVALMLRNDFATFEVKHGGRASLVPMPCRSTGTSRREEAGYILEDCRAKGAGGACPISTRRVAAGCAGAREGVRRAGAGRDRRGLWPCRPTSRRGLPASRCGDALVARSAPNMQAAQTVARQHDLHLGHDGGAPKGVRRPVPQYARAAGRRYGRKVGRYWGIVADPSIVVLIERPDVSLRARCLRHGQRSAGSQRRPGGALRGRGHAAPDYDRHKITHMHIVPTMFRAPASPARLR